MIHIDVSILLPLRDAEPMVAPLVDTASLVQRRVMARHHIDGRPLAFEFLALDERSGDNTASVLSVLHAKVPQLRTSADLERGSALRTAARIARGDTWLVMDHPIDADLAAWAIGQIIVGQRAAIVPGELLAVHRSAGVDVLRELDGGLVVAQRAIARHLRRLGETPAFSPASGVTRIERAFTFLRGHSNRVGLGFLDRPLPNPLRSRG